MLRAAKRAVLPTSPPRVIGPAAASRSKVVTLLVAALRLLFMEIPEMPVAVTVYVVVLVVPNIVFPTAELTDKEEILTAALLEEINCAADPVAILRFPRGEDPPTLPEKAIGLDPAASCKLPVFGASSVLAKEMPPVVVVVIESVPDVA